MRNPGDDFAVVSAAPVEADLAGRRYLVSKMTPRRMGRLQAALNAVVPDPRDAARKFMEGLPDAVAIHVWNRACEDARGWPVSIGSPEGVSALLASPDGVATFLEVLLAGANAGFDRRAAEALAEVVTHDELAALMRAMAPGDPNGPKATATAGEPAPGAS